MLWLRQKVDVYLKSIFPRVGGSVVCSSKGTSFDIQVTIYMILIIGECRIVTISMIINFSKI